MLLRKLLRDLWTQKTQLIALVVVQGLGVLLFGATWAGYENLTTSYAHTRDALALADVHVDVRVDGADAALVDDAAVARVAAVPGVARAAGRLVASFAIAVAEGHVAGVDRATPLVLEGRVISLPARRDADDDGQPVLDRLHLLRGGLPTQENGAVLETHLAAAQHLDVGDHVDVVLEGGVRRALVVEGVAVSAEYLWVSRDARDPMPAPDSFGVLWLRQADVAALARAAVADAPVSVVDGALSVAARGGLHQVLYDYDDGFDRAVVDRAVDVALGGAAVVAARTAAADLVGPRLLQLDVDGMRMMAVTFPLFFLAVAGFIALAVLARLVDRQRQIIGTLRALGLSRARVVLHMVGFGGVIGIIASVVGAVGGFFVAGALTQSYATELGIPFVSVAAHVDIVAAGVGFGLLTSAFSSLVPAWRAAGIAPAAAMQAPHPETGWLVRASGGLGALPLWARLSLRNALRHPLRVLAAAAGVAAALVLVLTTVATAQSLQRVAAVQLNDAQRYDVRVDLLAPLPAATLEAALMRSDAVGEHELSLTLPVLVRARGPARGEERALLASAVAADASLLRPVDFEGAPLHAGEGILLPAVDARALGVEAGASVDVRLAAGGAAVAFVVSGVVDTALGPVATVDLAHARAVLGVGDVANTVAARAGVRGDRIDTRAALQALPGAAHLFDVGALRAQLDQLLALNVSMVGTMLLFAVVLGAAILSTMATLSILERARELATLRALGMSIGTVAGLTTVENGLAAVVGLAVGLPLARFAAVEVVGLFGSDLMAMPFVWSWGVAALAATGTVVLLLVAQLPALRGIARLDLAANIRSREG